MTHEGFGLGVKGGLEHGIEGTGNITPRMTLTREKIVHKPILGVRKGGFSES